MHLRPLGAPFGQGLYSLALAEPLPCRVSAFGYDPSRKVSESVRRRTRSRGSAAPSGTPTGAPCRRRQPLDGAFRPKAAFLCSLAYGAHG